MQLLITGALGWLGKRLVRLIAGGQLDAVHGLPEPPRIRCLILPGQDAAEIKAMGSRIEVREGDIRSAADCKKFCEASTGGVLIHTAGIIHPNRVSDFYEINQHGTAQLVQAAAHAGVKRAVVVSSNSPIGCNPHPDHLFDEQSPYHPYMNYGRSKVLMEQAVQEFHRKGDIETVIVRPPWFYGPDQPPRQTLFFSMIKNGKGPIVGSGDNLRSMAYVDNLSQGLMLCGFRPAAAGQTYWIADRRPYSMNEIVDTVENLLEQEFGMQVAHKRLRLPGLASEVAQVIDFSLQSMGMYHQKIHVLSEMNKTIACSIAKAERELGYNPAIVLEEGMRRSIRWCIDQGIRI